MTCSIYTYQDTLFSVCDGKHFHTLDVAYEILLGEKIQREGVRGKEIVQRLVASGRLEDDWKRSHALDVL